MDLRSLRRALRRRTAARPRRPRWNRGGRVVHTIGPYGNPMTVMTGGNDAPLNRRGAVLWFLFALIVVGALFAIVLLG